MKGWLRMRISHEGLCEMVTYYLRAKLLLSSSDYEEVETIRRMRSGEFEIYMKKEKEISKDED